MASQTGDTTTQMHDVQVDPQQQQPSSEQYGQQQYPQQYEQQQQQQQYPQQYDQSPQYIGGQPAPPQTYSQPQPGQSKASGLSGESFKRVLTSPDGILRLVEWLFALISFATMASATGYSSFYSSFSQFQFLVAAGVITWIWTMAMLTFYIFDLASKNPVLYLVELAGDFVLVVFEFAAGVASAAECNTHNGLLCDGVGDAKAAIAFAFLTFFALLGSMFFDWKKYRGSK